MNNAIPNVALSVRQPWAWAIIHAGKDIENRDWRRPNPGLTFRGRTCIHASAGMTRREYESAADFMAELNVPCPPPAELDRGGLIGMVDVVDIVRDDDSPWFVGRLGLVLRGAVPLDFIPCAGALGFFGWERSDGSNVPAPARWMLPNDPRLPPHAETSGLQGELF